MNINDACSLHKWSKVSKEQKQSILILVEGDCACAVQIDTNDFNKVTNPNHYGIMVSMLRKKMQDNPEQIT
jgi:hypothetical protein